MSLAETPVSDVSSESFEPHMTQTEMAYDIGEHLKELTTGCKLDTRAFGCSRVMTESQRAKMAAAFAAEATSVRGGREIIKRRHQFVKPLFDAIAKAKNIWKDFTVKYEDNIRLIRTDKITWMNERMAECQDEAQVAAQLMKDNWEVIVADAQERLSDLFIASDYDFDPTAEFGIFISYPAIQPDDRLKTIAPEVYEIERKRIAAQFESAAAIAEEGLKEEFAGLVDRLLEKLEPGEEGKKKVIQERVITGLAEFADRFKVLSVNSSDELQALVEEVKAISQGTDLKELKANANGEMESLKAKLAKVKDSVGSMVSAMPTRKFDL